MSLRKKTCGVWVRLILSRSNMPLEVRPSSVVMITSGQGMAATALPLASQVAMALEMTSAGVMTRLPS